MSLLPFRGLGVIGTEQGEEARACVHEPCAGLFQVVHTEVAAAPATISEGKENRVQQGITWRV